MECWLQGQIWKTFAATLTIRHSLSCKWLGFHSSQNKCSLTTASLTRKSSRRASSCITSRWAKRRRSCGRRSACANWVWWVFCYSCKHQSSNKASRCKPRWRTESLALSRKRNSMCLTRYSSPLTSRTLSLMASTPTFSYSRMWLITWGL